MIKGSLRLILGEWKDTTSVQQAACAALLLALLLLPGCSELALPSEEMPAAGADPSYVNIVAHHLKTLFKKCVRDIAISLGALAQRLGLAHLCSFPGSGPSTGVLRVPQGRQGC